ncbi:MAG: PD-(D/E)XK nuclease-like domain-containing protein [Bauldia sp.]|nr:PD-(D/E)XK nuclease-like domain-containing protein [Bauldia sp.]
MIQPRTLAPGEIITEAGVYFGLDENTYHRSPWLGSTDIRRLRRSAPDFWWHSWMNPARPEDRPTEALIFGRAVHRRVLEGAAAFERRYAPAEYPGNIKAGKDERAEIEASGRIALRRADYDRISIAGSMIALNPNLADAFSGGAAEVSVFWHQDGVPMKCRFDYLKLRAIADLKSIRNSREIDFVEACKRRAGDSRFDIQARHYSNGRRAMGALVRDGRVAGEHDADWLSRVISVTAFAFVFVFWQAEDAPITWAYQLSPENPILTKGQDAIDRAVERFRSFSERFGPDEAWVLAEPINEMDESDLPPWWDRAA